MKLEVEMVEFVFRGAADAQSCAGEQVPRGSGTGELKLMENSMGSVWYAGIGGTRFLQTAGGSLIISVGDFSHLLQGQLVRVEAMQKVRRDC